MKSIVLYYKDNWCLTFEVHYSEGKGFKDNRPNAKMNKEG